jgi:hypothetical protein
MNCLRVALYLYRLDSPETGCNTLQGVDSIHRGLEEPSQGGPQGRKEDIRALAKISPEKPPMTLAGGSNNNLGFVWVLEEL